MINSDELDVDFEIIEEPEDVLFPRLPNIISHRGHKIKVIALVRNLPEPEPEEVTTVSLRAKILVLDHKRIGEKEHASCPAKIWGEAPVVTATFPSNDFPTLPFTMQAIVSRRIDDDHLGEGPGYQALVNVTTSSGPQPPAGGAAAPHAGFDDDGLHIIEFMSK